MRSFAALVCVILFALSTSASSFPRGGASGTPANWYSGAWQYRKAITIHHGQVTSGDSYTNFPVLITEATDANLSAHAQPTGNDILFTASDGKTKLNHEIESYTTGTGNISAWVQVAGLSTSVDTILYMYYGNPSATNQQNVAATWDSRYAGVYHLASSNTGYSLNRSGSNPVLPHGGSGSWDYSQVYDNFPMADPNSSGQGILFYSGMAAPVQTGHECVGTATFSLSSPTSITPNSGNPIICDSDNRRVDSVTWVPGGSFGTFYLYSTDDSDGNIYLYTSADNRATWTSQGVVLSPTGQGCSDGIDVSQGAVILIGGVSTMIYAYRTNSAILPGYRYATASDGKTFTKGGCTDILSIGPTGSEDSVYMEWHQLLNVGSTFMLFYECFNGTNYYDCAASSSSLTSGWKKAPANAIFEASQSSGAFDQYHVASPFFMLMGSTWWFMYSGADLFTPYGQAQWSIGLATLSSSNNTPLDIFTPGVPDSTVNANSAVAAGMTAVTGQIDGAFSGDGVASHIATLSPAVSGTSDYTVQAWMLPSSLSQLGLAVMNGPNCCLGGTGMGLGIGDGTGSVGSHLVGLKSGIAWEDSGYVFASTSAWVAVAMVQSSGTTYYYANGAAQSSTYTQVPTAAAQSLSIAAATGTQNFAGSVDEVRVSNVARSAAWLATEYSMESTPGSFYSIGAEVPY